jgi:hypothetical protein
MGPIPWLWGLTVLRGRLLEQRRALCCVLKLLGQSPVSQRYKGKKDERGPAGKVPGPVLGLVGGTGNDLTQAERGPGALGWGPWMPHIEVWLLD